MNQKLQREKFDAFGEMVVNIEASDGTLLEKVHFDGGRPIRRLEWKALEFHSVALCDARRGDMISAAADLTVAWVMYLGFCILAMDAAVLVALARVASGGLDGHGILAALAGVVILVNACYSGLLIHRLMIESTLSKMKKPGSGFTFVRSGVAF